MGVTIGDGVIGIIVGWLLVGDGVALAVAVPVCVDGVGLAGFAKVQPATTLTTLTSASTMQIIAIFLSCGWPLSSFALQKSKDRDMKRSAAA